MAEESNKKWIVLGFGVVILGLVVAGIVTNKQSGSAAGAGGSGGAGGGGGGAAAAPSAPDPVPSTNEENDRVRQGNALPFPITGGELEGGLLVSADMTANASQSGGVEKLAPQEGRQWVLVQIEPANKKSILGQSIVTAMQIMQPMAMTSDGSFTEACGILYKDAGQRVAHIDANGFVRGLAQAPRLDPGRNDQTLWLVFLLPKGQELVSVYLGKKQIAQWVPAVKIK